jgi:hypothetical protein
MRFVILIITIFITHSGVGVSKINTQLRENKINKKCDIKCDKHIIIGDSQTPYVDMNSEMISRVSINPGKSSLWEGGKTMSWLISAVELYKIDSTVCSVTVVIGTNGGFGKFIKDNPKRLFELIKLKFPNAKILAVQGSWGWGGLKGIKESDVRSYYENFKQYGVEIVEPPIGRIEPHGNKPIYKKIGQTVDSLLRLN